jgi:hypothetical protein
MSWQHKSNDVSQKIQDIRRVPPFKSFCRKCACHHPLDSEVRGFLKGCICNPAGRRGECGRYVPTDSLEFLEYLAVLKEEE